MYFNSNSMLVFFIACGCLVYGKSFDISKIILRVKSFLCSENSLRMFMSQAKNRAERCKF